MRPPILMTSLIWALLACESACLGAAEKAKRLFGGSAADRGVAVWLASPRAGLLFADNEQVDVRVRVAGAAKPKAVEFTVAEVGGPFTQKGAVTLPDGATEKRLPLTLPGRGPGTKLRRFRLDTAPFSWRILGFRTVVGAGVRAIVPA